MQFHRTILNGIREQLAWSRSQRESVGFGTAGVCPTCNTPNARLLAGWYNGTGAAKAQFRCIVCNKSWTFSRKPK